MSLVSLAAGITDLAVRVGQECKSIRTALAAKADTASVLLKDSTPGAEWRAPALVTGGGTIGVTAGFAVSWTQRLIVMGNGRHAGWNVSGFFDISMPADGTVIPGVGGAADVTVTNGAIVLPTWGALYYIASIGAGSTSLPANFRVVSYLSTIATPIPDNWIPVVMRNSDNASVRWSNGIVLATGQSWSAAAGYSWLTSVQDSLANHETRLLTFENRVYSTVESTTAYSMANNWSIATGFSLKDYTNGAIWVGTSNWFVIPTNGLWHIDASCSWAALAGGRRIMVVESFTGTDPGAGSANALIRIETGTVGASPNTPSVAGSRDVYLAAGTRVRMAHYQNTGAALNSNSANAPIYLGLRQVG